MSPCEFPVCRPSHVKMRYTAVMGGTSLIAKIKVGAWALNRPITIALLRRDVRLRLCDLSVIKGGHAVRPGAAETWSGVTL